MVVAWRERRATETACRGRSYGAARRSAAAAEKCRVVLSCGGSLLLNVSSLVSVVSML